MFEHLLNCHGEWNALLALAPTLSFLPYWLRGNKNETENE
jgi:hypothetical protein